MRKFLDASGLNRYHNSYKSIVDSSLDTLDYKIDSSISDLRVYTERRFDVVDSSISQLRLTDIELANAIEILLNTRDTKYEELSNRINNIVAGSYPISLNISQTIMFVGDSSTLTFTAKTIDNATSIIIKDANDNIIASGSGTSLVGSTTVTPSTEGVLYFTATAVINGTTISVNTGVKCVNKIYYGSGVKYTDATNIAVAKESPQGTYAVTVSESETHIYFVVPSSMTISKISMNGLSMPITYSDVTISNIAYKSYESINTYDYGVYNLYIE